MPRRPTPPLPRLMTSTEAEDMLKLSHSTVQRLIREGTLEAVDVGGSYHTRRLRAESVEAYLRRIAGP